VSNGLEIALFMVIMRTMNRKNVKSILKKFIIPLAVFAVFLACQHSEVLEQTGILTSRQASCENRPISLEITDKTPIFDDKDLPQGILVFDSANVYMEKLDEQGDVTEKVIVSEEYTSAKKENREINVRCVKASGKKLVTDFDSMIPALKKIEIGQKGSRLFSNAFEIKVEKGQVKYSSEAPTAPTSTTSVRDFFERVGVNYAFYKTGEGAYEFRGHKIKDRISSYISVKYQLVQFN